jgi:hypothetical protein
VCTYRIYLMHTVFSFVFVLSFIAMTSSYTLLLFLYFIPPSILSLSYQSYQLPVNPFSIMFLAFCFLFFSPSFYKSKKLDICLLILLYVIYRMTFSSIHSPVSHNFININGCLKLHCVDIQHCLSIHPLIDI